LPWLARGWWASDPFPKIRVSIDSNIACVDTVASPKIYMLAWVSGGDDIQFAYPNVADPEEWMGETDALTLKGKDRVFEPQAAIGKIFEQTFPPIGQNVYYDIDVGYCTSENLGPITDICKRYSQLPIEGSTVAAFVSKTLDWIESPESGNYYREYRFRHTLFGNWRSCFLFRSGGYRFRYFRGERTTNADHPLHWRVSVPTGRSLTGTYYIEGSDRVSRLTIPQVSQYPFLVLGTGQDSQNSMFDLNPYYGTTPAVVNPNDMAYIAARDDLQLGYPILPRGIALLPS